jgi:hypothetical protein
MKQKIQTTLPDECDFREEAARYVTGETVSPDFAAHCQQCIACQEAMRVWQHLARLPIAEPRAELTREILAACEQSQKNVIRLPWHRWAAAALLIMSLTSVSVWQMRKSSTPAITREETSAIVPESGDGSVREALDWFCRAQESDGSWSPARWGGDPRFEVALTALPMLAILSAPDEMTPQRTAVIDKAKRYLLSHCDEKGRFGPTFYGSSYSQGIATLALLSSYQQQPDADIKLVLHRALDVIISQQQVTGCWGAGAAGQSDVTVTLWQVEALKAAQALGWDDVQPHLSLASKWLAQQSSATAPALDASPEGVTLDYFAVYFATTQLKQAGDATALDQLASIRHALLRKQVQQGAESGSWSPDDRWATAGGRLYTTAMVSLALR